MNEADLCELILENTHLLKCFECGATLESKMNHATNKTAVGILHIDPGESNYPREPDISASAYFECMDCHETEGRLDSRILELAKTNNIVHSGGNGNKSLAECNSSGSASRFAARRRQWIEPHLVRE